MSTPRVYVEPRGRAWRLRYRVAEERPSRPMPTEQQARFAAELVERALAARPDHDPWPMVKQFVSEYAGSLDVEPQVSSVPTDLKRHLTVKEWYDCWLPLRKPDCRPANYRDYQRHATYFLPHLGHLQLSKVSVHDLVRCRAALLAAGKRGTPLATHTVKNILCGTLKRMFRDARSHNAMKQNPFDHPLFTEWPTTNNPRDLGPRADPFTVEEKAKVIETLRRRYWSHVKLKGLYAYVLTLMNIPFRPSECSGLQWQDVDLAAGRAHVRRSFHDGTYVPPKTRTSRRMVLLPQEVVDVLRRIQPLNVSPESPVFLNRDGKQIDARYFSPTWNKCLRLADVRQRGLYACKDTAITLARLAGCSWAFLEAQSGVAERTLTRHYFSFLPEEQPNEFEKFAEWERARLAASQPHPIQPQSGPNRKAS